MSTVSSRYQEEIAKSAELLRQALPLMSQQNAGLHPVSYAVWYEYVAGTNPALKAAVQERLAQGQKLDDDSTADLFRRFIADIDENEAERINESFQRILNQAAESAAKAESKADAFSNSLARLGSGLHHAEENYPIAEEIQRLLHETKEMQNAVCTLQDRLSASQQEIEKLKQEVCRAREEALLDALTGLINRKGLDAILEQTLAHVGDKHLTPSLIIADIDHFKNINDNYGHLFGDRVIRAVAHVLGQNVKGKDTAARYGGEEFVLLLPETPLEGAERLAETIRHAIEHSRIRNTDTNQTLGQVTVSFGVASYLPGETAASFLERADRALYSSKQNGRNRVTVAR